MTASKRMIGRGMQVFVAPSPECDQRVIPEDIVFTVAGAVAPTVGATAVEFSTDVLPTKRIPAPFWLAFVDSATGIEYLVKIVENFNPADSSFVTAPLKRSIPIGATAIFPVYLSGRQSASFGNNDQTTDTQTFDSDGWQDSITTLLGDSLELPGFYSPTNAGYWICRNARSTNSEIFVRATLPKPGCNDDYTKGEIRELFSGVQMDLIVPSDGPIESSITLNSRGKVYEYEPV